MLRKGIDKIKEGMCPLGKTMPSACLSCLYGHVTECHYSHTCDECKCGHWVQDHMGIPFVESELP